MRHVLRVLMWKHMKEKMRRPIHTIWSILSGVLVFIILLFVKHLLVEDTAKITKYIQELKAIDIVYTPNNKLTRKLMAQICSGNYNGSVLSDTVVRCHGLQNDPEMVKFLNQVNFSMSDILAAIHFENFNGTDFPLALDYDIRFITAHSHHVSKLEDLYHIFQKDLTIAKNMSSFANLQWEIDKVFLETISGQDIKHVIQLNDVTEHVSPALRVVHSFLILCTVMAPLPFFLFLSSRLVIEKRSGLKELIKLVGVSRNILMISHFLATSVYGFVYAVIISLLLKITNTPILMYSSIIPPAIMLFLHFLTTTALSFVTSTLSQNYQHSDSLALLIYLTTFLLNTMWYHHAVSNKFVLFIIYCLLPHAPVFAFWDEVTTLEEIGEGANFINMWSVHDGHSECHPIYLIITYFLIQLLIILTMAWYLDMVRPGVYGIAAKWNFCFKKKFWVKKNKKAVNFHVTAERTKDVLKDARYYEKPKHKIKIAIKIAEVGKVFRSLRGPAVVALDGVSLDVYKGEITVLLGANGAGKTTLMSIITGMYNTTQGTVYINGLDNSARLRDVCKDLAYCPQRDLTFEYLTVKENLLFFQSLRGSGHGGHITDTDEVMANLKLEDKANYYSNQLSTGLRRCLQVGCVLVGDADVLVLDEPTSGMDAHMRHNLWDLLLTLRKEKTILMTSTLMQEADALGDRIAILHRGKLKCHGSPAFLKNAIGADFKLSIRLQEECPNVDEMTKIIEDLIKQTNTTPTKISVSSIERNRVTVMLPSVNRDNFPEVFNLLEAKKNDLKIASIDVGISMDQVFLRFIDDGDDIYEEMHTFRGSQEVIRDTRLEGWELMRQQLKVLIIRCFTFVWKHKYQFMILQMLLPFLALSMITVVSNTSRGYNILEPMSETEHVTTVLYHPVGYRTSKVFEPLLKRYPHVEFITTADLDTDIKSLIRKTRNKPHQIFGYKMVGNRTDIFYRTNDPYIIEAVNIFSNIFLSLHMPYASESYINITYSRMNLRSNFADIDIKRAKNVYLCGAWAIWVSFLSIVPIAPLILICIDEYCKGVRFRHMLAGCPPFILWLSKLAAHMCIYTAVVPTMVIIVAAILDTDETFTRLNFLFALLLLYMTFGPAFFINWYVLSFAMGKHHSIAKIYIITLCCSIIAPLFIYFMSPLSAYTYFLAFTVWASFLTLCLFPAFVFSNALITICIAARSNAYCKLNYHLCPDKMIGDTFLTKEECCKSVSGEPENYFQHSFSMLLVLLLQSIFYWCILMLLQNRVIQRVWENFLSQMYTSTPKIYKTTRVKREEEYVHETIELFEQMTIEERQRDPEGILAENLHKSYDIGCRKGGSSVKGVSFAVKKGECLGIIGRNSSGKSIILGMVSGYTVITRGKSCVNGNFLHLDRKKYLRNIAWSVSSGFDDFLTGYKNLRLLALLYGYPHHAAQKVALFCLQFMGLASYSRTLFSAYSSGCAHRLAVCLALLGEPRAALLDEPCKSVDPHSRSLIFRAVRRLLDANCACLMAEESMEWRQVDRICSRLAIIDRGELVALGSVAEIRKELASGYTANIKLKVDTAYCVIDERSQSKDSTDHPIAYRNLIPVNNIFLLKLEFLKVFPTSVLVDEHISILYFHIEDPSHEIPYSELFSKLEELRKNFDVIEDYTLSETSLEEVLCRIEHQLETLQPRQSISYKDRMLTIRESIR